MKTSKFSEAPIVAILREGEAGVPVTDILRKYGISRPTFSTVAEEVQRVTSRWCRPAGFSDSHGPRTTGPRSPPRRRMRR